MFTKPTLNWTQVGSAHHQLWSYLPMDIGGIWIHCYLGLAMNSADLRFSFFSNHNLLNGHCTMASRLKGPCRRAFVCFSWVYGNTKPAQSMSNECQKVVKGRSNATVNRLWNISESSKTHVKLMPMKQVQSLLTLTKAKKRVLDKQALHYKREAQRSYIQSVYWNFCTERIGNIDRLHMGDWEQLGIYALIQPASSFCKHSLCYSLCFVVNVSRAIFVFNFCLNGDHFLHFLFCVLPFKEKKNGLLFLWIEKLIVFTPFGN